MTIHKSMGETIGKIVTKNDSVERDYNLWEREQLYVLVSRVQRLSDLTFIGTKENTLDAIKSLIKKNLWDLYTEELVKTACNQSPAVFKVSKFSPFRPQNLEIPNEAVGFVFILVSIKDVSSLCLSAKLLFYVDGFLRKIQDKALFAHFSTSTPLGYTCLRHWFQ